ncbi:hypothetical protein Tco_1502737 [Tanacetum coccineum]
MTRTSRVHGRTVNDASESSKPSWGKTCTLRGKVLESRENATSKKKLVEVEMKLELARMEHDMVERRLHAS